MKFEAMYIKGWGVAKMNQNGLTISKMVLRCGSKKEAKLEARRLNKLQTLQEEEPSTTK